MISQFLQIVVAEMEIRNSIQFHSLDDLLSEKKLFVVFKSVSFQE